MNSADGREVFAKQYQNTLFNWDTVEATKMRKADKRILERAQILFNFKVIVSNLHILKFNLAVIKMPC